MATGAKNHVPIANTIRRYVKVEVAERASAVELCRIAKAYDQSIKMYLVFGVTYKSDERKAVIDVTFAPEPWPEGPPEPEPYDGDCS